MQHPDEEIGQRPGRRPDDGHLDEGTIHAWLDGALGDAEAERVERHAASCESCAATVAEARGLVAAASRILTRLDDVPAAVIPAGVAASAAPIPASAGPRLARGATGPAARRRRRWVPTVWTLSAAAAAALMAVLVTGDEAERLLERPAATSAGESVSPSIERATTPADAAEMAESPRESPEATARSATAQSSPAQSSPVPSSPVPTSPAQSPPARSALAPAPEPGMARAATEDVASQNVPVTEGRTASALSAVAPAAPARIPPPVVANEEVRRSERRVGGFVPRAADAPAPAQAAVPEQLRARLAGARGDTGAAPDSTTLRYDTPAAATDFQLAEVPVWSDSLTRARLPRRIGFGRRILAGARLIESSIVTTAPVFERRSIYELEDGARVTLVEGPSSVRLEAVVTTGVDASPAAPETAAKAVVSDDSVVTLEPDAGETIVVRPDGTARLQWSDGGTALALEGPLSIDRLRALRERVRY